ncbi:MAG: outer membrane beta-barrel domain-containing protein [Deltaproteobacteria bacterium]|nr:outer membrane beta-barrel domain-containing protein [Deltaproteobacteria bacterium]
MNARFLRISTGVALLALCGLASPALAVGPTDEVVQERLYDQGGRFDLSLLAGMSVNNKLLDQYAIVLEPAYQFTDAWAFQLTGGYVIGVEKTSLTGHIRMSIHDNNLDDEFADMGALQWLALGSVRWSPVYGKLSISAVMPVHVGAYISAGGGFVGVSRHSLAQCSSVADTDGDGRADQDDCVVSNTSQPAGTFGLGLRFYLADYLAIRGELKGFLFQDKYTLDLDAATPVPISGMTTVLTFFLGTSFYF